LPRLHRQTLAVEERTLFRVRHANDVVRADLKCQESIMNGNDNPLSLLFQARPFSRSCGDKSQQASAEEKTPHESAHDPSRKKPYVLLET
jgi:hypothetical protein